MIWAIASAVAVDGANKCPYTSAVTAIEECPKASEACFNGTPLAI